MKKPIFAWYDFWIGLFYDKRLYVFPIPMIGFHIEKRNNYEINKTTSINPF
jgi:hypothetical protein